MRRGTGHQPTRGDEGSVPQVALYLICDDCRHVGMSHGKTNGFAIVPRVPTAPLPPVPSEKDLAEVTHCYCWRNASLAGAAACRRHRTFVSTALVDGLSTQLT